MKIESKKELLHLLKSSNMEITFRKADGTARSGVFTLRQDALPPREDDGERRRSKPANEDLVSVYEVDKSQWRSFNFSSLISAEVI